MHRGVSPKYVSPFRGVVFEKSLGSFVYKVLKNNQVSLLGLSEPLRQLNIGGVSRLCVNRILRKLLKGCPLYNVLPTCLSDTRLDDHGNK